MDLDFLGECDGALRKRTDKKFIRNILSPNSLNESRYDPYIVPPLPTGCLRAIGQVF